jgi:hydroxymethylpyrimidine pyrophosphatase-like HAD family hydrolase
MSDWRPRLIASDMDGTLLRWDDTVSDATVAELAGGRAVGVP